VSLHSRILLDVALNFKDNFKVELQAVDPEKLYDRDVLLLALERTKDFLDLVIFPESRLRARWNEEEDKNAVANKLELQPDSVPGSGEKR